MLCAALAVVLTAQPTPPPRLIWTGLTGHNVDEKVLTYYSDAIAQRLSQRSVQVMSSSDIAAAFGLERQRQLMGCIGDNCGVEISEALDADAILRGSIGRFGEMWQLELKIVSNSAEVWCAYSAKVQGEEALLHEINLAATELAPKLYAKLGRTMPVPAPAPAVTTAPPAKSSEPSRPLPGACSAGQAITGDTQGHCCWPGQAWASGACVGVPTSCPKDHALDVANQRCVPPTCANPMERMADGLHCCWPGQAWAAGRGTCVGVPRCPQGYLAPLGIKDGAERCLKQPVLTGDKTLDAQCSSELVRKLGVACDVRDYFLQTRADLTAEEMAELRGQYRQLALDTCQKLAMQKNCALKSDVGLGGTLVYCCQR